MEAERLNQKPEEEKGRIGLIVGFLTSVLSVGCCAIPVVLVSLGLGGAWASRLEFLDRVRPLLVVFSLLSLGWGIRRYTQRRQKPLCKPNGVHGIRSDQIRKGIFWAVVAGSLLILFLPWMSAHFFHLKFFDRDPD